MNAQTQPDNEAIRRAVWVITDHVSEQGRRLAVPDGFVAHDAEGVVLVAASGHRADTLREMLATWEAQPEALARPASPVTLS